MNITVIGSGYVGLVAGVCLAEDGHQVICADNSQKRVDDLKIIKPGSHDPELTPLLAQEVSKGSIVFTTDIKSAVQDSEMILIAVGTPEGENGRANLDSIFEVCSVIGEAITGPKTILIKSTIPIGTTDRFREILNDKLQTRGLKFSASVMHTPEFLVSGQAIKCFKELERLVIGCKEGDDIQPVIDVLSPYVSDESRILIMDTKEAELCKYMNNCMLATRISFVNEMANIAKGYNINIYGPLKSMKLDKRIGPHYLHPGLGYGGSCLPKDVKALINMGKDVGYSAKLLEEIDAVNDRQVPLFCETIKNYFQGHLKGKTIAFWGVSFKCGTVELRESLGLQVLDFLVREGAQVKVYDPNVKEIPFLNLHMAESKEETLEGADALVVCTDEQEFADFDFASMKKNSAMTNTIFDGKGKLKLDQLCKLGFQYYVAGKFHNYTPAEDI